MSLFRRGLLFAAATLLLGACRPEASMRATTPAAVDAGAATTSHVAARDVYLDASGAPLDGRRHRYILRLGRAQLPPEQGFWSLRLDPSMPPLPVPAWPMLDSGRLSQLQRDADGSITLYLQHAPPPAAQRANWVPAPNGPFLAALRYDRPTPGRREARWNLPPIQRAL